MHFRGFVGKSGGHSGRIIFTHRGGCKGGSKTLALPRNLFCPIKNMINKHMKYQKKICNVYRYLRLGPRKVLS